MFFRDELWWAVRLTWYWGEDYVAWARPVEGIELAVLWMGGEVGLGRFYSVGFYSVAVGP